MTLAPADPIDRAWWHLHLSPEILYADQRDQPDFVAEPLEFDDGYDDYDEDRTCEYCGGDGGNPWDDFIMECPVCLGEGVRW